MFFIQKDPTHDNTPFLLSENDDFVDYTSMAKIYLTVFVWKSTLSVLTYTV